MAEPWSQIATLALHNRVYDPRPALSPLAVLILGKMRRSTAEEGPNLRLVMPWTEWVWKLAVIAVAYAVAGKAFLDALSSFYALLPQSSLYAAMEALKGPDYVRRNVQRVIEERASMEDTE
ncbi:MAG: hypothetical protein WBB22_14735 [Anaerolineae bacterium]